MKMKNGRCGRCDEFHFGFSNFPKNHFSQQVLGNFLKANVFINEDFEGSFGLFYKVIFC
jgi:hypothetical protein